MLKPPKNDEKHEWTNHVWDKMIFYGISESKIKRIIRFPSRIEEGVALNTIAVMQPAGTKKYQEIWVMYSVINSKPKFHKSKVSNFKLKNKKFRIITAWRYPGKSPNRDPVPNEILNEVRNIL